MFYQYLLFLNTYPVLLCFDYTCYWHIIVELSSSAVVTVFVHLSCFVFLGTTTPTIHRHQTSRHNDTQAEAPVPKGDVDIILRITNLLLWGGRPPANLPEDEPEAVDVRRLKAVEGGGVQALREDLWRHVSPRPHPAHRPTFSSSGDRRHLLYLIYSCRRQCFIPFSDTHQMICLNLR